MTTDTSAAPTGEATNIGQTRGQLRGFDARAALFIDTADSAKTLAANIRRDAAALMQHANNLAAQMHANEVDSGTLAVIASMREQAAALLAAADRADKAAADLLARAEGLRAASVTALHGINTRHTGVEEATAATPEGGAVKDYYSD